MSRLVLVGMLAFGSISPTFTTKAFLGRPTFDQEIYDEYQAELDAIRDKYRPLMDPIYEEFRETCEELWDAQKEKRNLLNRKNSDDITDPWLPSDEAELQDTLTLIENLEARLDELNTEYCRFMNQRRAEFEDARERYIDRQYGEDHEDWGIY